MSFQSIWQIQNQPGIELYMVLYLCETSIPNWAGCFTQASISTSELHIHCVFGLVLNSETLSETLLFILFFASATIYWEKIKIFVLSSPYVCIFLLYCVFQSALKHSHYYYFYLHCKNTITSIFLLFSSSWFLVLQTNLCHIQANSV